MINVDVCLTYLLLNEGGLEEDKDGKDPGGITNFGLSLKYLRSLPNPKKYGFHGDTIEADDVRHLNSDQAKAIYRGEWWKPEYEMINNQKVVNYLFDTSVNCGPANAVKMIQRACNCVMQAKHALVEDGVLGSASVEIINHCLFYLMPVFRAERLNYYHNVVRANPKEEEFLNDWIDRSFR